MAIQKYLSEKDTAKEIEKITGKKLKKDFFIEGKNAYGDRHEYSFGFWLTGLGEYPASFQKEIEEPLIAAGFEVINIWVGSYVHGWIHRVIKKEIK